MESHDYDFSEDEIREQLAKFGFNHIPDDRLQEFKKDLDILIRSERHKLAAEARVNASYPSDWASSPEFSHGAGQSGHPATSVQGGQSDHSDGVTVHVTGVDPHMRRVHTSATYYPADERRTRSAPTSPAKSTSSAADSEREKRVIKRKVARKVNGESFIDESFVESESDDSSFHGPHKSARGTRPLSDLVNPQPRRPPSAVNRAASSVYWDEPYQKSVIYPMALAPNERNLRRCDRLARYNEFREYWAQHQIPGEKSHRTLRLNVRENMLQYEPIVKSKQRNQVRNEYVVPTDKKRMDLRWQVRADLAEGRMPSSGYVST